MESGLQRDGSYKKSKRTAVVGIGNTLMGDEGVGIKVIDELRKRGYDHKVDLIDAGTAFFNIVQDLSSYEKVIIVDIAKGGGEAGTIYRFELDDIEIESFGSITAHDIGVVQSLKLYSINHRLPEEIVFFGIEPYRIELSMEISAALGQAVGRLVDEIEEEIMKEY